VTVAHFLGVKGFHIEYLLFGATIGLLGAWMWRTGGDVRAGMVMVGIGVVMAAAAFVVA
jgi:hypothetical protein